MNDIYNGVANILYVYNIYIKRCNQVPKTVFIFIYIYKYNYIHKLFL